MLPFKNMLPIDPTSRMPIYIQITNGVISQILTGKLVATFKLPGSRTLAQQLGVHRKTIVAAYDELEAQGWIETLPSRGSFVSKKIPNTPKKINQHSTQKIQSPLRQSGFPLKSYNTLDPHFEMTPVYRFDYRLDDGLPDVRLAPIKTLARHYKSLLNSAHFSKKLNYSPDLRGDIQLRKELTKYISETRSINVSPENIMIVRGSIMGFYLLFQLILEKGDHVIVGETNFFAANQIIKNASGKLVKVKVDGQGIDVDQVETICKKQKIRAIYIVPHHHHPTTVSLSAERRMRLLQLAEKYQFAIIEDDYDYDFHYESNPVLPLASSDRNGSVAYVGSLSKSVAPAFRIGFVVAPENVIQQMALMRRFVDRQGDVMLERTIAILFQEGEIRRHLRKSLKMYHQRRDFFCQKIKEELNDAVEFKIPEGGLATWTLFNKKIALDKVKKEAFSKGLFINSHEKYNPSDRNLNALRLGFASMTTAEMEGAIQILKKII